MPNNRTLGGDPMNSRLVRQFGYRGSALVILGCTWVLFGGGILLQPGEARPWVFHELLPTPLRAGLWACAGIAAIIAGLRGSNHDDTVGMVALMLMPLERFVSFAVSYIAYIVSLGLHRIYSDFNVTGYKEGWYAALVWLVVVTLLRLIAGWPNPRRIITMPSGDTNV